jgi:hypothetical protein
MRHEFVFVNLGQPLALRRCVYCLEQLPMFVQQIVCVIRDRTFVEHAIDFVSPSDKALILIVIAGHG